MSMATWAYWARTPLRLLDDHAAVRCRLQLFGDGLGSCRMPTVAMSSAPDRGAGRPRGAGSAALTRSIARRRRRVGAGNPVTSCDVYILVYQGSGSWVGRPSEAVTIGLPSTQPWQVVNGGRSALVDNHEPRSVEQNGDRLRPAGRRPDLPMRPEPVGVASAWPPKVARGCGPVRRFAQDSSSSRLAPGGLRVAGGVALAGALGRLSDVGREA